MNKNQGKLIISSLLLGTLFSFLFFEKEIGISFPIYICIILLFSIFWLKENNKLEKNRAWFFALPIMLLSLRFVLSSNNFFNFFNFIIIVGLLIGMSLLLAKDDLLEWANIAFVGKIIAAMFLPFKYFAKPYQWLFHKINKNKEKESNPYVKKVIAGLIISFPLLIIIIILLSSADMVFNDLLSDIPSKIESIFDTIFSNNITMKSIIALLTATYFYGYIWNSFVPIVRPNPHAEPVPIKTEKQYFDSVILITVLTVINVIYIIFSVIQFSYLFSGGLNILPSGFTYAEYARRGFFELLLVTMINFSIILISIFNTNQKEHTSFKVLKGLLFAMGIFNYIMIYSSFYRMRIYEQTYGYTYLRIFVYFFLLLEAIILLGTLIYIICSKFNLIKMYVITFLVLYIGLNYMNIDNMIAKENIDRYFETGKIDFYYLRRLSYDTIPQMQRLLDAEDSELVQDIQYYLIDIDEQLMESKSWQEFNWSKYKAKKVIENLDLQK